MANTTVTPRQQEYIDAFIECGSYTTAAKKLGIQRRDLSRTLKRLEASGRVPWLSPAPRPDHMRMAKTTVQYNSAGDVMNEWRRIEPRLDQLQAVVEGLCDDVRGKGKAPAMKSRKTDTKDVLFELDIYDAHVGMYADERETLDGNYDCDIAARRMVEAAEGICRRANRPGKVVVVFGGDMLHADNRSNMTEQSGHVLDVDTRYNRVIKYIITACREVIKIAASIGAEVEIVVLRGNHSYHSEAWLAQVLDAYYCEAKNVTVNLGDSERRHMVFGENLLIWAHGDKIAAPKWAQIIAAEFPKQWGVTKFRHAKLGHVHHQKAIAPVIIDEQAGLLVEYLPALCATDAWHSGAGFIGSQKGAVGYEYHKTLGCMTRFFQPV